MVQCPYCHHENQEGTLYCEQCKSDLAPAEASSAAPVEGVPMANVVEGIPLAAEEKFEPFAAVAEAIPVEAMPVPEPEREADLARTPTPQPPEPDSAVPPATVSDKLPPDAKPRLVVLRGMKINSEYPLYEGLNFIGRADEDRKSVV